MNKYLNSLEDTELFAQRLAELLQDKTMTIAFEGDLGAGKTTFTQFFGKALGVKHTINSPTFTILKSYTTESGKPLHHIDAYRLEGAHQDLGFEECFEDGLCVVEWAEYIEDQLPDDHLNIKLTREGEFVRVADLEGTGPVSASIVDVLEIMEELDFLELMGDLEDEE